MKIQIVRDVLEANDQLAGDIRNVAKKEGFTLVNIMSSPGSGKTTFLERLIPELTKKGLRIAVIEGDITTTTDAERIAQMNIPVAQINTEPFGGDCHLGAEVILPALHKFDLSKLDLIFIENVGNLVCPAEFDTGANFNFVVISTTEGEDKPLKYPLMFRVCDTAIINKIDLVQYLDMDISLLEKNIKQINSDIRLVKCSAKTGENLEEAVNLIVSLVNSR
ncbi:MAG: hydrogenase nickel incorporation protein HypB [Candidatus Marinimicrobia bacterium]|nr:hydrogenase nickel incorporation protein HypB [Candidatus Neomarinimicrobiota bacterium]